MRWCRTPRVAHWLGVAAGDLRQTKGNAKTSPGVASEAGKELRSKQSTTREKSVAGSDLRQVKGAVKKRA